MSNSVQSLPMTTFNALDKLNSEIESFESFPSDRQDLRKIAAGVRAGAHVRDLESHGVLPFGNQDENWQRTDARIKKEQNERLRRFERDTEEDYLNWVKTKEQQKVEEKREKARVRSMLEAYNPWGKPGGGAPGADKDHRREKFTEQDLGLDKVHQSDEDTPYYKTGGGAPSKTKSGRLKAGFQESQDLKDIRFKEETAKDIENKFRYEPENLTASFGKLGGIPEAVEVSSSDFGPNGISIVEEMIKGYPYATATAQDNKKKGMLTRNQKPPLDHDVEIYDPWGKGFGGPDRDNNGNVRRYKFSDPRKGGILAMGKTQGSRQNIPAEVETEVEPGATIPLNERGGAGAPRNTKSGNVTTRFPQTLIRTKLGDNEICIEDSNGQRIVNNDSYHPWGKPGAGAPRRDTQGQLVHRKMRVQTGDQRLRLETRRAF